MGVKFQTREMERTVVYRFKSQKVMKYNFKQKRMEKKFKKPFRLLKLEKVHLRKVNKMAAVGNKLSVATIDWLFYDTLKATPPPSTYTSSGGPARCIYNIQYLLPLLDVCCCSER